MAHAKSTIPVSPPGLSLKANLPSEFSILGKVVAILPVKQARSQGIILNAYLSLIWIANLSLTSADFIFHKS